MKYSFDLSQMTPEDKIDYVECVKLVKEKRLTWARYQQFMDFFPLDLEGNNG